MKPFFLIIGLLTIYFSELLPQESIITMTTEDTVGSSFTFSLIAKEDDTPIQIDYGDGELIDEVIYNRYTTIYGSVKSSQKIKIYGEGITHLNCSKSGITSLDVTNDTCLKNLNCSSNKLSKLDISQNYALNHLICYENLLDSIDVRNKSELTYLFCNKNKIARLDLGTNHSLTNLECGDNLLNKLDVSMNPNLMVLVCTNNSITELDVSNNALLQVLYCGFNQLDNLDLSTNIDLVAFACENNHINELSINNNMKLVSINCNNNQLTNLEIFNDTVIEDIYCNNNQLSELDLTYNKNIRNLDCTKNKFSFATLPIFQETWWSYHYAPQKTFQLVTSIELGDKIDLSEQYLINGNRTDYKWKTLKNRMLVEGTDYTIALGKTTFLRPQPDSVYCEMTNVSFPELNGEMTLKTNCLKLKGENMLTVSMESINEIGKTFSFRMKAAFDSTPIRIDFGNGILVYDTIGNDEIYICDTLKVTQTVNIYGNNITHLNCENNKLVSLEINNDSSLLSLNCMNNLLSKLDLSKSKKINNIDCSYNNLNSFILGNDTVFKTVTCNSNQLTFATLPIEQASWNSYTYAPQAPIPIIRTINVGDELNLSNLYSINSNITSYTWKTQNGTILLEGTDYSNTEGSMIFHNEQTDSIYCEFTNILFSDLTDSDVLKTTNMKIESYTSREEILTKEFEIYSFGKTLFINIPFDAQLSIYDVNGRLVATKFINNGVNCTIQMPYAGIYIIRLSGEGQVFVRKTIFQ